MSTLWGISALSHDAALAVIKERRLVFASHSERYSRVKNDKTLNWHLLRDALNYGSPNKIFFYEKPFVKLTRNIYARQWDVVDRNLKSAITGEGLRNHINSLGLSFHYGLYQKNISHHYAHAAGGYYTSKFRNATVVVIDAIGEWEVLTIWQAEDTRLKKIYSQKYPHSIGLFYSAMTQRVGLMPNQDEYILMGMAPFGDPTRFYEEMVHTFFRNFTVFPKFKRNLHRGCLWWRPEGLKATDIYDVAAATQLIYEQLLDDIMGWAHYHGKSNNLVFSGGCALNAVANSKIAKYWDDIWIMPNPGDAGTAVGAILADLKYHIRWPGPFLGHEIPGKYPVIQIIDELEQNKVCGVASGKAEYGPRALGRRSLLADPREKNIKDTINKYKKREPFRPFAPMVLEECADNIFEMPVKRSPYMQYTAKCKVPDQFPGIVHVDGTSRVQTVGKLDDPDVREMLEGWFLRTGCPVLLNTSLNIKGEPLVNSKEDAKAFERKHKIKVFYDTH
jgi:carbamoyltransferase